MFWNRIAAHLNVNSRSFKLLLQVIKGENLEKIKVGLPRVDGMGDGYSAICVVTIMLY